MSLTPAAAFILDGEIIQEMQKPAKRTPATQCRAYVLGGPHHGTWTTHPGSTPPRDYSLGIPRQGGIEVIRYRLIKWLVEGNWTWTYVQPLHPLAWLTQYLPDYIRS